MFTVYRSFSFFFCKFMSVNYVRIFIDGKSLISVFKKVPCSAGHGNLDITGSPCL